MTSPPSLEVLRKFIHFGTLTLTVMKRYENLTIKIHLLSTRVEAGPRDADSSHEDHQHAQHPGCWVSGCWSQDWEHPWCDLTSPSSASPHTIGKTQRHPSWSHPLNSKQRGSPLFQLPSQWASLSMSLCHSWERIPSYLITSTTDTQFPAEIQTRPNPLPLYHNIQGFPFTFLSSPPSLFAWNQRAMLCWCLALPDHTNAPNFLFFPSGTQGRTQKCRHTGPTDTAGTAHGTQHREAGWGGASEGEEGWES